MKKVRQRTLFEVGGGGIDVYQGNVAAGVESAIIYSPCGRFTHQSEVHLPSDIVRFVRFSPDGTKVAGLSSHYFSVADIRDDRLEKPRSFRLPSHTPAYLTVGKKYGAIAQKIYENGATRYRLHFFEIKEGELVLLYRCEIDSDEDISMVVASEEPEEAPDGHQVIARFVVSCFGEAVREYAVTDAEKIG